jgi:ABC-2 type transport system ATP-binding protein
LSAVESLPGVRQVTRREQDGSTVLEFTLEEEGVISSVLAALTARRVRLLNLSKHEPTLEDVFVELVGRSMEQEENADNPSG